MAGAMLLSIGAPIIGSGSGSGMFIIGPPSADGTVRRHLLGDHSTGPHSAPGRFTGGTGLGAAAARAITSPVGLCRSVNAADALAANHWHAHNSVTSEHLLLLLSGRRTRRGQEPEP
jgi:hypothetical protein